MAVFNVIGAYAFNVVVLILSSTYFIKHLDLLKSLYTYFFWIAETQSWKLSSRTLSFTIQTIPASKTNKCYLQNSGRKGPNISMEILNIHPQDKACFSQVSIVPLY